MFFVPFVVSQGNLSCGVLAQRMIERVTLDGFESGFVDELDDIVFSGLIFVRRFHQ